MCLAWLASTMSGVQRLGLGLVLHLIMAGVSRAVAMAALWCLRAGSAHGGSRGGCTARDDMVVPDGVDRMATRRGVSVHMPGNRLFMQMMVGRTGCAGCADCTG